MARETVGPQQAIVHSSDGGKESPQWQSPGSSRQHGMGRPALDSVVDRLDGKKFLAQRAKSRVRCEI